MSKTVTIVGRVSGTHPSGQYTTCGCTFTTKPQAFEVSPEDKAIIDNDSCVIQPQYGSRQWCEAVGIPFTEEELRKLGLDVNARPLDKKPEPTQDEPKAAEPVVEQTAPEEPKEAPKEEPAVMSKRKIVAELKARGKVEGVDFDKNSKAEDLQALLNTL